MAEPGKKLNVVELNQLKKENELKEIAKLKKKIPDLRKLDEDVAFMKSFSDKMSSKVFKGDTLHIMHTVLLTEILAVLKEINNNLSDDEESEEETDETKSRTSKKLSREK
jgi:hypothetical protein